MNALELDSVEALRIAHQEWIDEALRGESPKKEEIWSQSVAVGNPEFIQNTQAALGFRGRSRRVAANDGVYALREEQACYNPIFDLDNGLIESKNVHYWDISYCKTAT